MDRISFFKHISPCSQLNRQFTVLKALCIVAALVELVCIAGVSKKAGVNDFVGAIHTGVVYLLYFSSMRELSGQIVAALSYIDPVVAILLASVFLNEKMTIVQVIGGILILGSTFFNEICVHIKWRNLLNPHKL